MPQKKYLSSQVYSQIKTHILEGKLSPGAPLSENKLCEMFSVSRTPIRNAVKILEREEFLTVVPKFGILIKVLSEAEILQLFEARKILETAIIDLILDKVTADFINTLRKNLEKQKQAFENEDRRAFLNLDEELHLSLARLSGNKYLYNLLLSLREKAFQITYRTLRSRHYVERILEEHRELVDALEEKNRGRALACIKAHLGLSQKYTPTDYT